MYEGSFNILGGYSGQYLDTVLEFNQETRDWKLVGKVEHSVYVFGQCLSLKRYVNGSF